MAQVLEKQLVLLIKQNCKDNGVVIGLFTTNSSSTLGEIADQVVIIPTQSKQSKDEALQPMGSLFEQTSLFLYDSIILNLMEKQEKQIKR